MGWNGQEMTEQIFSAQQCEQLLDCIHDELSQQDTAFPLFHGSWDWHSAVHGHWAALWLAHHLHQKERHRELGKRLFDSGKLSDRLEGEIQLLATDESFELPYGRAWLIRLVILLEEQFPGCRVPLEPVVESLVRWLREQKPNPRTPEYNNPTWVLIQLYAWGLHRRDTDLLVGCQEIAGSLLLSPQPTLARDGECHEFFSCWSLQLMLRRTTEGDEAVAQWLQENEPTLEELQPIQAFPSAHCFGMNPSRCWGLVTAYQCSANERYLVALREHLQCCMGNFVAHNQDRYAYRHWVPQFLVYGLYLDTVCRD